uniref:(northern house mosquito) hypothetical protein n=1 Tax=Culex pipiens TaxID=7175 RepID=A0A8D8D631_CULPI
MFLQQKLILCPITPVKLVDFILRGRTRRSLSADFQHFLHGLLIVSIPQVLPHPRKVNVSGLVCDLHFPHHTQDSPLKQWILEGQIAGNAVLFVVDGVLGDVHADRAVHKRGV